MLLIPAYARRSPGASLRLDNVMSGKRLKITASFIAASFAALLVSGCAVGPDFLAPTPPDVTRYTKEPLTPRTASTDAPHGEAERFVNGRDIRAEWWALFRSRALDSLVRRSLAANPSLQAAIATLRSTKETVYAQQGKYFPFVQANFNPVTGQSATAVSSPLANGATSFNLVTAQLLVSYTFDAWGLNRRTVESLQALSDTQRFQVEAAYVTLASNVVVAAIQEASLRGQIDATNMLIDLNVKMLELIRGQFNVGYANRNDVALQEAAVAQIRATLPPLNKALAQQRDLLSALAGRFPSQEPAETFKLTDLRLPIDLPVSLPAQLIQQRPDVRAAEEQLHSTSALVGVAIANMLPNLTISAGRGYTAADTANLFTGPAIFWTVAGNATQPVFDGLNLLHTERAAEGTYEAAAWNYRSAVITAFQNVADSLRAVQNDADELKAANEFKKAAKVSLDLAQQQMQTGYANFLYLLTAQVTYQSAVLSVVLAEAARLSDAAALFQALGGGWWNRIGPPAPEQKFDVATQESKPVAEPGDPITEFFRLFGVADGR
jgi:NodT family efflux transporter outer membrane factor (OMF) lipoprotein